MKIKFTLLACLLATSTCASAQTTLIHAGQLLAVPGKGVQKNKTVIVKDGKIHDIRNGFLDKDELDLDVDTLVVDRRNGFVMPGLIDMHTHIGGERDPKKNPHQWTTLYEHDAAFSTIPYMENTINAGFTTVRNLGGDYKLMAAAKRAVAKGLVKGPKIVSATNAVTPTGGHGDTHGYRPEVMQAIPKSVGVCDGADDCRRAVRALVKQGADVIKITATGGVLSNTNAGVGQQLTDDELKAIVETAHSLGRKVAAHAHAADGINAALRAGVNSIEHGSFLNDESIRLFKKTGAYLVPTLLAGTTVTEEMASNPNIPPNIKEKVKQVAPAVAASFQKALKAKINIAFGTDSGVSKHGTNAREFELMVDQGMDNEVALKTATIDAATLLGKLDQIGTLEKGKVADIISIKGDPLKDISSMKNVSFVMQDGKVIKQ